jgi:DNA polymerase-3 subunit delta
VLVSGAEDFFASEAIGLLRTHLRTEDPSIEVHEFNAKEYTPGELSTVVTPSLFNEPRLVIAQQVHESVDAFLEEALAFVAAPIDDTTLVLRHRNGNRGKKLLDAVRANEAAIEVPCAPLKANELHDFLRDEFRARRRKVSPEAAQALVAAFNTSIEELAAAARQLMSIAPDDEITGEIVNRYYGGRVETTGFKIADATIAGRLADALMLVRAGFDTGLNSVPIVLAIAMKLRTMAKVSGLSGSDAQLAGQVGAAPWQVGQARRELRGWSDEELGRAIRLTAETDFLVKGGSRDPEFATERLVRRIATRDL